MKENRLLLCIHQIGDLGKNNSKYFTFMNYFDRFAIQSPSNQLLEICHSQFRRLGGAFAPGNVLDLENSLD